jgi:PAT family beta-lactamase induction signal transducer AmpG
MQNSQNSTNKAASTKRWLYPWLWIPTLYFAEGLPYMAVMTISVIMYKCLGIDNTSLAFYTSWLYLPWVIKPFWSPFVDILRTKRWWVVTMQFVIAIALALIALTIPTSHFFQATLAVFWFVAFSSATHDIAADGFYMIGLQEQQQAAFVGIRSLFYRISMIVGQGGLVVLAANLNESHESLTFGWIAIFAVMSAFFFCIALYHWLILPRPVADADKKPQSITTILQDFANTFYEFFRKPGILVALVFMLFYRLPEALMVKMIPPFLLDSVGNGGMGLESGEVGWIYGTVGALGLILGGIIGGVVAAVGGLKKWLHPMAWSMSLTCLTFVYLAFCQPSAIWEVYACVFVEQFGYGFGFTAYMLYLIFFSIGKYKTAHYSICTGFMALGMMLPGLCAGWLADHLGYVNFFLLAIVCCIATIGVCYLIKVPADFGKKTN